MPTLDYKNIDLEAWHPDAIFIHNPYDGQNYVTSIDGRFFSDKLRKCTDLLVYSPYFVTAGSMGEGQGNCSVFRYVDYIIVQSESLCRFYDASVPMKKLVPLGSPKLDRVIRLCKNPPDPPAAWKEKLRGKRVYFYNTSLNGLLSDLSFGLRYEISDFLAQLGAEKNDFKLTRSESIAMAEIMERFRKEKGLLHVTTRVAAPFHMKKTIPGLESLGIKCRI